MTPKWIELVTGSLDEKKRYRRYKARIAALPESYRTAVEGVARYLMYTGPGDGDQLMTMLDDLADLFEQSAADGVPVHAIVGDDPVAFVDTFKQNYGPGGWLGKEQRRLTDTIARAEGQDAGGGEAGGGAADDDIRRRGGGAGAGDGSGAP